MTASRLAAGRILDFHPLETCAAGCTTEKFSSCSAIILLNRSRLYFNILLFKS